MRGGNGGLGYDWVNLMGLGKHQAPLTSTPTPCLHKHPSPSPRLLVLHLREQDDLPFPRHLVVDVGLEPPQQEGLQDAVQLPNHLRALLVLRLLGPLGGFRGRG